MRGCVRFEGMCGLTLTDGNGWEVWRTKKSVGLLFLNSNLRNVSNLLSYYILVDIFFPVILTTTAFHRVEWFLRDTYSSIIAINANKRFRRDNIYVARWWKLAICRTISVNIGNQKFVSAGGEPAYDIKYGVKKTRVAGESERLNFKRDF